MFPENNIISGEKYRVDCFTQSQALNMTHWKGSCLTHVKIHRTQDSKYEPNYIREFQRSKSLHCSLPFRERLVSWQTSEVNALAVNLNENEIHGMHGFISSFTKMIIDKWIAFLPRQQED